MFMLERFRKNLGFSEEDKVSPKLVQKFFKHVVRGEQEQVEGMLEHNPELLLEIGDFNDLADRDFTGVDPEIAYLGNNGQRLFKGTAYQYVLLALDDPMRVMLEKRLKNTEYYPEHEAQEQALLFRNDAWIKSQDCDAVAHLQRLIDAVQGYIDGYDHWTEEQREDYWCKKVGGAELLLPMNIFHAICFPWSGPAELLDFTNNISSRTIEFINYDDGETYNNVFAFSATEGPRRLGFNFGLTRRPEGGRSVSLCKEGKEGKDGALKFRMLLQLLLQTRVEQRKDLIKEVSMFYDTEATSSSEGNTPRSVEDEVESHKVAPGF